MYKMYFKRLLDIIFSLVFLPIFLIILLFVSIAVFFDDRGSLFYIAPRLGKNGQVFQMYKFRSMKENAPDLRNKDGSTFNSEEDPRVTKTGKILRKTSIDEIPQFLNVVKGDMSFIGPRPDLPEHIEMYENEEIRKLEVRPGITGYSQAYYRNSIPWKQRLENDIYYVDNISFLLDIRIIMKTIVSVFKSDNVFVDYDKGD